MEEKYELCRYCKEYMKVKKDIRDFDINGLKEIALSIGAPAFISKQIFQWLWQKDASSFEEMTNLSKNIRATLSEEYDIRKIEKDVVQRSNDGTIKMRFKLFDGHLIESVLIPVPKSKRFTVCVSSQVGCSLTCSFCATGQMKRVRNLSPGEILDQVNEINKECLNHYGLPLTNIVYMGMGEPLLAFKEVMKSIEYITSPNGLAMSPRRITVSTAGIAKMIKKMADLEVRFNLALSLHAADDEKRDRIMPINESNNLETLMDSLKYFHQKTNSQISYEYIALRNFNDSIEDARNLAKLCHFFPVKVNVIEYNPVDGVSFKKSDEDKIDEFAKYLKSKNVLFTLRRSRGKDIDAACGQLANKN